MWEQLKAVRQSTLQNNKRNLIFKFVIILLFGLFMGVISKYSDTVASNDGIYGAVVHKISEITTDIDIWVFIATLIAMYSYNAKSAMVSTAGFFLTMLTGYYLYSRYVCGFYSARVILFWIIFALLSSVCAWIVWYGKGNGWISDIFAAMPIGFLLESGYRIYYSVSVIRLLDIISVIILLVLFSVGNSKIKGIRVFMMAIFVAIIMNIIHIQNFLFGGY